MERKDLTFRVFVSSTFSDLIPERNALQERTFPALEKYCQEHGARFQAIDLRWGVSSEASLDQQTMKICFQELARCQAMSPRPNFIILLGERYGWRPLPAEIVADEFDELLAKVPEEHRLLLTTGHDVAPFDANAGVRRIGWYRKDLNAVPPTYVLQPRVISQQLGEIDEVVRDAERTDWTRIEIELRQLLIDAIAACGWSEGDSRRLKYERSATHQEVEHGALHDKQNSDHHVFGYFREITGAPTDGAAIGFVDTGRDLEDLTSLKSELAGNRERGIRGCLPEGNVTKYSVEWSTVEARNRSGAPKPDIDNDADLKLLCDRVYQNLVMVIETELKSFQQRTEIKRENEAHGEFASERSRHFVGRHDTLDKVKNYLDDPEPRKPLVVHGISGSGKTAFMARAWLTLTDPRESVARFIGATPGSADLRSLLRGLCQQLGIEAPPTEMNELVRAFRERLAGREKPDENSGSVEPAVVFLDALDQLNPTDNARMLYWLPRELAPGVKLVVSALQDQATEGNGRTQGAHDCFDIARRIWPESLVEIGALGADDGRELLQHWFDATDVRRTLQDDQRNDILTKFAKDGRPLYLKLAFEEARHWRSWEGLPCGSDAIPGLNDSVDGILADMFDRLEQPRHHGRVLVEHALGNIAAAKNGLTEDELLGILSAKSNGVMEWFYTQSPTENRKSEDARIQKLPIVVWSRLYADLRPYMVERRADGTVVMNFYHRQVGEAVMKRYFGENEAARLAAHVRLAEYFAGLDYWAESLEDQRARAKRLPPTPRPANVRKVVELPYHRLEAAKLGGKDDPKSPYWDAVAKLLLDWQFLEAKAEADPNFVEQETVDPTAATGGSTT